MSHPHTTQLDRDVIEDMQLVDDDRTEDMRTNMRTRPPRDPALARWARAVRTQPSARE